MRINCMETPEYGTFTLNIIVHHIDCMRYTINIIVDESKSGAGVHDAIKYHEITICHNRRFVLIYNEIMN